MNERDIFIGAIQRDDPVQRREFVHQACGADATLQRRVEELLSVYDQGGAFPESPVSRPDATMDQPPVGESPGTVIGPYKLLQQIGEGGMGVVWMAEQTQPVQRKVALKVIKPGMDSGQVIARFEAERQALALMDHVNIARVFDGGTTGEKDEGGRMKDEKETPSDSSFIPHPSSFRGRPYFVMELVHGVPITKYCDDNHLTPRERLELFVPVCQAIQHAHQKGIIHRDIKPSNVMVTLYDGKPVPKVIDFGVAKATEQKLTERTLFTQYGAMVGTLEYMSPEQAEMSALGVDTRSDIYSLGVLLYELLTGSTPLTHKRMKEAAYAEILRMIKEEEPQKPSTRLSDSGEALASISAQRHTEPAKLTKLVRGELDWIVMKCLEKDRNRRYETANGFAADVQRYLADEPVQACPPSVGYRLRKFVRRNKGPVAVAGLVLFFLLLLGGGVGWVARDLAARQARAANDLERALDRVDLFLGEGKRAEALAALDRAELLAGQTPADPARDTRLAALKERLDAEARDQEFLARFEDIRLRAQSQVDVEKNRFSDKSAFLETREALRRYGIEIGAMEPSQAAAYIQGRPETVRRNLVAALDECARYTPRGDSQTLQWLRAALDAADDDPWRLQVRKALAADDRKVLEQLLREADVRKQPPSFLIMAVNNLPAPMEPTRLELLRKVQRAYPTDLWANHHLAIALFVKNGQPAEAIRYFTAAITLRPENPALYFNRGNALRNTEELDAAIADYRQSLALAPRYVEAHNNLGHTLHAKGQLDAAIAAFRESMRLRSDHPETHNVLGFLLQKQGKLDAAIAAYHKAIDLNPKHVGAHIGLGDALETQGQSDEAIAAYRKAIDLKPKFANAYYHLGHALYRQGKPDAAIAEYREAIRLKADYAEAHYNLGRALRDKGQLDAAIACYHKAIELDPKLVSAHQCLGTLLCEELRDYENAADCFRKAIELDPTNAKAHTNLGVALRAQGKTDAAIAEYHEAIRLDKDLPDAHNGLGLALGAKGELEKAIVAYREAIRLDKDFADAHYNLGGALYRKNQLDAAIAEYREAIRVKKDFASAHYGLGVALATKGQTDDAIAAFREAIRLKKDLPEAHYSLGFLLQKKGRLDDAITEYREAIRLKANYAEPHVNIGNALASKSQLDAAIDEYREAIRIQRKLAEAHGALGVALATKGQTGDAITEFREAIRLKKDDASPHFNLGKALVSNGKLADAIAEYREAIRLKADYAEAYCNLGHALRRQGELPKALEALRRGHEIGSKDPRWPYPSALWVRQCEREVELNRQLPDFLAGKTTPVNPDEQVALAELCARKRLNRAAVGFFAEGFAREPKLADDLDVGHRYNAACAAALAGCGQGKDVGTLDDKDRARLRRQALDWLRADLEMRGRLLVKKPVQARLTAQVMKTLQHWLEDPDFAGVRGPEALAKLPEAERQQWQQLWGDVADTLARAQGNMTPDNKSHAK